MKKLLSCAEIKPVNLLDNKIHGDVDMEQTIKMNEKLVIGMDVYAKSVQISTCGESKVVVSIIVLEPDKLERYNLTLYTKTIEDNYGIRVYNYIYKDKIIIIEGYVKDIDKIAKIIGTILQGTYRVLPPSDSIGSITSKDINNHICIDMIHENDLKITLFAENDGTFSFYIPECSDDKSIRMVNNRVHNINTGLKLHIPEGYVLQVFIDSKMITNYGITIPGGSIYYTPADKDTELVIPIMWDGDVRQHEIDWHARLKFYPSNTIIARGILLKYKSADIIEL